MLQENEKLQIPAAEENILVEEITLQMEELESRVAPSAVWGS